MTGMGEEVYAPPSIEEDAGPITETERALLWLFDDWDGRSIPTFVLDAVDNARARRGLKL
jgi:hypothetical protein